MGVKFVFYLYFVAGAFFGIILSFLFMKISEEFLITKIKRRNTPQIKRRK